MEDTRWLRLATVGLVLAALAVGYLFLSGKLAPKSTVKNAVSSPNPTVLGQNVGIGASTTAYNKILERNQANATPTPKPAAQANVQQLPSTGFPAYLVIAISAGAMISGWGLKKFPH